MRTTFLRHALWFANSRNEKIAQVFLIKIIADGCMYLFLMTKMHAIRFFVYIIKYCFIKQINIVLIAILIRSTGTVSAAKYNF